MERYFRQPPLQITVWQGPINYILNINCDMPNPRAPKGLQFSRRFTNDGVSPYDMFEYDYRDSVIKNPNGEKVFEMNNVEVPKQWSQIATDILAQKYFRKAGVPQPDGSLGRETSVKQVAHRMAHCWRVWGERYGYFASEKDAQVFYDELAYRDRKSVV